MLIFNKYFYKNKKSKLYFGDRVAVLNDFIYQTGGSMWLAGQDMLCLNNWWCQCLMLVLQPIADDTRKLKDFN
jgi:hypothetical protein